MNVHPAIQKPQPWSLADATDIIRSISRGDFTLHKTHHFTEQMRDRDLAIGDVLHILKNGFVHTEPQASSRDGYYKYKIDSITPNSGNRLVRVVVLPCNSKELKVITVMWVDEDTFRG
ncbi:MAG: DUF4258 domain-containing protein [Bauldia sp.]|nr:DUF4258 domain-containing protein [Bauldia sp.]